MRYFTLAEAERALPAVERLLRDALFQKAEYQRAHAALEETAQRVRMSGGSRVDPRAMQALRTSRDSSLAAVQRVLEEIEEAGALVKDLDIGLLDFMTRYRDRDVCLCWKLGEDGIRFWHGEEEGFRGRKPIDQEFLANHSTELR
ncbi:MAG: DUF2203 domain-containing protein [Bryobacteraceae bacterium]